MATEKKTSQPRSVGASSAQEPEVRVVCQWTLPKIEQAKRQADRGDLSQAAALWDAILGDERAIGPLQAITGVSSLPVEFESENAESGQEDPKVEALQRDWWHMLPEDVQGEVIRSAIGLGVALVQIKEWREDEQTKRLLPVLDPWASHHLKRDGKRRTWLVKTEQNKGGQPFEPGDGEWILFTPYGRKRPWLKAPWYGLGLLWFAAQCSKIDWADWNDSHAKPMKAASNEKAETHGLVDEPGMQKLLANVVKLVRGGSIVLPDGYKLQLLEASSRNWESFLKLCHEVWPMALAIALTGNNLTTQVEGGSFAAAREATAVLMDRKRTVARCFETTVREQLLTWWSEFNFGDLAAPWPKYKLEPPSDPNAAADRLSKVATAVQALTSANVPLSPQELRERYDVPVDLERAGEATPAQLFQYHFTFGIITINEARQRIGLKPVKGGDKPPKLPESGVPPERAFPELAALRAFEVERAGIDARAPKGLASGEEFIDELEEQGLKRGQKALRPDVLELMELIRGADDLPSLRLAVTELYGRMDPAEFAEVIERIEILAAMSGRFSAVEEI